MAIASSQKVTPIFPLRAIFGLSKREIFSSLHKKLDRSERIFTAEESKLNDDNNSVLILPQGELHGTVPTGQILYHVVNWLTLSRKSWISPTMTSSKLNIHIMHNILRR